MPGAPIISIVVPMYRCEQTVAACIRSILSQSAPELELIAVDDGSPDRAAVIVREFAEADARVRVLSQKNGGVSRARNAGIEAACGEYVLFVDADDELPEDAVKTLLEAAKEKPDIVRFGYTRCQGRRESEVSPPLAGKLDREEIRERIVALLVSGWSLNACWAGMYRREMLVSHSVRFPEGVLLDEDFAFVCDAFAAAESAVFLEKPLYRYILNGESAVRRMNEKHIRGSLDIQMSLLDRLYTWDADTPENRAKFWSKMIEEGLMMLEGITANRKNPERRALFERCFSDHRIRDALEAGETPALGGVWRMQIKLMKKNRPFLSYALFGAIHRLKAIRGALRGG